MKTLRLRKFNLINLLLLSLLLAGAAWLCKPQTTVTARTAAQTSATKPPFTVRSYGGKCLEVGLPRTILEQTMGRTYPVFIADCKGTAAQQVRIEELTDRPGHLVILRAGSGVIGKKVDIVANPHATAAAQGEDSSAEPASFAAQSSTSTPDQTPLEVQPYTGSAGQIFALDGDSIILAAERNLVVEVKNNRGANGTPLVLGNRDLADAEFWTFTASDGSNRRPTQGFVRISQTDNSADGELRARADFLNAVYGARRGAVIELDSNVSLNLTDTPSLPIPAGVTIRGDRRGIWPGPELWAAEVPGYAMLVILGNEVRLTGLRLRGPSRSLDKDLTPSRGIQAPDGYTAIIDHNDLSDWQVSAISVTGTFDDRIQDHPDPLSRPQNVRIARNFIHHNRMAGAGYGVVVGSYGGYPFIEGNTFLENRHAIAGDGTRTTGYRAWFNLVLHAGPDYGHGIQQDFDMHGRGNDGCQHCGGIAGQYIEIARNTFLGAGRENFYLRGTPTYLAEFHHNVLVWPRLFAIKNEGDPDKLIVSDNQFTTPNPAQRLGVGDFDGDGTQDLFLATGAAWYYAPAGKAEWRYLNAQTDKIDTLLFGDFDADGRTDVFTQHAYSWDVSWGGASRWENINVSWSILGNAAVGDFIGDERDDIFYADGQTWYASDGGVGSFTPLDTSSARVPNLRFGDFNGDGKTDVFGVANGEWSVAYSGTSGWTRLRSKLTDSVAGLTVADFNGDRRADVATSSHLFTTFVWKVSYSGTDDWTTLRTAGAPLASAAAIGRFEGNASADVLLWHDRYLDIAARGTLASTRHSREDMR